jgi:mono/diheme cytochrome c family protein
MPVAASKVEKYRRGFTMKMRNSNAVSSSAQFVLRSTLSVVVLLLIVAFSNTSLAQTPKKTSPSGTDAGLVSRGQYIVEGVAMCGTCHTPRTANGQLDRSRWLAGAPVPYQPSTPTADWPTIVPRIAGLPPASNAGMITLLTTGIWITGQQLKDPMPKFHMTVADAEAVLAYLKSLTPGR